MSAMLAIERHIYETALAEQLQHLSAEIVKLHIAAPAKGHEAEHLAKADSHLQLAIQSLKLAKSVARWECQAQILESQLEASVELIGRSPEAMRREKGER